MSSRQGSRQGKKWVRGVVYALVVLVIVGMVAMMAGQALAAPASASERTTPTTTARSTARPTAPAGGAGSRTSSSGSSSAAPIVVIGTSGLTWQDVIDAAFRSDAATQDAAKQILIEAITGMPMNLVQKTAHAKTCPADGWLTLSAGARTTAASGSSCTTPTWSQAKAAAKASGYTATPGALADSLTAAGTSYAAIGSGAVLALTRSTGAAPRTADSLTALSRSAGGLPALTLVDASASSTDAIGSLASALAAVPAGARVALLSVGDPSDDSLQLALLPSSTSSPQGASDGGRILTGPSTHQPGVLQLTDIAPTLLTSLGASVPTSMTGSALTIKRVPDASEGAADVSTTPSDPIENSDVLAGSVPPSAHRIATLAEQARASKSATIPVGLLLVVLAIAALAVGAVVLRGEPRRRGARTAAGIALASASLPTAVWLASALPWRMGDALGPNGVVLLVLVTALVAGIAVGAGVLLARRSAPAPARATLLPRWTGNIAAALVPLVILVDGATGAHLGFNGLLGMDAITAGRFYGVSNTGFALAAAGLVVALAAVIGPWAASRTDRSSRRRAVLLGVGIPGAIAVVLDGAPGLGTDVGGALTLVIVLSVLAAGLMVTRLGWRRGLIVVAAAVAAVAVLGGIDYATGSRTHMGRFVGQVLDGSAGTTIARKLASIVEPFTTHPIALLALVVGLAAAAGIVVAIRREGEALAAGTSRFQPFAGAVTEGGAGAAQWLPVALRSLAVLMVVEVLVNDSGAVMALFTAVAAAPMLIAALCSQAVVAPQEDGAERAQA